MTGSNGEEPGPWSPSKQQLEIAAEKRRQIFGSDWREKVARPHRCNPHVTDFFTALWTRNNIGVAASMTWACFRSAEGKEERSWLMLDHKTGEVTNKEFLRNEE
jgi:hypothetical protein